MLEDRIMQNVPSHVPPDLIVDFDCYCVAERIEDLQIAWAELRNKAPQGIFWTPRNGGHWVSLIGEDIKAIYSDFVRFSSQDIYIPPNDGRSNVLVPNELNPPEHGVFRRFIVPPLRPRMLPPLEEKARALSIKLIDGFLTRGECEFVREFAAILPVVIFLELMGLPIEDREWLRPLAQSMTRPESTEKRVAAQLAVEGYLQSWIDQRRSNLGSDMLSSIISGDVLGRPVSNLEALMMSVSLLLGGLDTVANMLCFVAIYLARNPRQRQQLIDRPELIPPAIEELIRRHGIVALGRRIVQDTSLQGVMLLNGDMIQAPSMLYGIDETIVEDPLTVNFERESSPHIAFGHGPHLCPGQHLARRELTIFVEEWLKRIPDFEVKPGTMPVIETGLTSGVTRLELSWLPPN